MNGWTTDCVVCKFHVKLMKTLSLVTPRYTTHFVFSVERISYIHSNEWAAVTVMPSQEIHATHANSQRCKYQIVVNTF